MVIAPHHSVPFLFVHVPKTGGTAIQVALKEYHSIAFELQGPAWASQHEPFSSFASRHPYAARTFFSFGFVRNPWGRMVSMWLEHERNPAGRFSSFASFDDFIRFLGSTPSEEFPFYGIDYYGSEHFLSGVSYVARFERWEDEWEILKKCLELPELSIEPKNVSAYPAEKPTFRSWYTDETAAIVARLYAYEIREYGYRFDDR